MKLKLSTTIIVCLLVVFATSVSEQSFAQEAQGGAGGLRFWTGSTQSHQTKPTKVTANHRTENAKILTGIRRLVPQEYPTIQAAIDSSVNGDTILVSDGIYVENIRFRGKAIVIASLYLVDGDTSHIEQTIIDGSNPTYPDSASVVYFIDGEDTTSVLCGFTITGGTGTPWTAPNQTEWRVGGGIFSMDAFGATIKNNHITENSASGENVYGGGVFFFLDNGFAILEGNRIFGNSVTADPGHGYGGGAGFIGTNVRIVGNVFERDTVVAQGFAISGGLDVAGDLEQNVPADGMIRDNVFRENIVDATTGNGLGGGFTCFYTAALEIRDNLFEGNIAESRDGWAEGGAVLIDDEFTTGYGRKIVTGNRFINNISTSTGFGASGGALEIFRTLTTVSGNYFEQNTAQSGLSFGGAIRIFKSAFRLENNIITENTAALGGAVYVSEIPQAGTGLELINNTIVTNNALSSGGGIRVGSAVQPIVVNSILWGNTPTQIIGSVVVSYSDVQGGYPGTGNIDADPLFADTVDYYLTDLLSPAIDAGNPDLVYNDPEDPNNPGNPCLPALGTLLNDMGAYGGPGLICNDSVLVGIDDELPANVPQAFRLLQNYPNPFNPSTTIEFSLPEAAEVQLTIYNALGQEVATLLNGRMNAGTHQTTWQAGGLPSGIYFYRLSNSPLRRGARGDVITRKMLLMK